MAAVGSKTLYCPGEFKPAILAYMAGIWSESEGNFFFFSSVSPPLYAPAKQASLHGGESGFRNPESWALESRIQLKDSTND